MALPTFFVIGAAKAGTTSLHHYLDQHPQVQMSAVKEPNFFGGPADGTTYMVSRVDDLDEYESLFDPACEVRGEASPSYTNFPRRPGVPEAIKALVPDAKLIYLVRDPIARTVSHHHMLVIDGRETRSLREALGDLDSSDSRSYRLTSQSFYAWQLARYMGHFPEENVLVIDQADLLADRRAVLGEVFAFLSVDADFTCDQFDVELFRGSERAVYPAPLRAVKRVLAAPARIFPQRSRDSVRRLIERRLLPSAGAPVIDDESLERLRELFAPDVERLRKLTGKAFAGWNI